MQFNSLKYIFYLIAVTLVYFIIPSRWKKVRNLWLLTVSYFFYMSWNPTYFLLILTSTTATYLCGLLVGLLDTDTRLKKSARLITVILCAVLNLGILMFFKYYSFLGNSVTAVLQSLNIAFDVPKFDLILPVGISFYTFQALGYSFDVYSKKIKAERDFGKYALFVSFFPQLVAGPIERSANLLGQFDEVHKLDYDNFRYGLPLIAWGLFKKMVIADRVAVAVNMVYNNAIGYSRAGFIIATLLFSVQIFCDFSAYTDIARGSARLLGFRLMENFRSPYFADNIRSFWRRWHISLTSWFKDYLYIPMGGSRVNKFRHYLNILVVFLVSGLWHGAGWTFVIWGALHGLFQIAGMIKDSLFGKLFPRLKGKPVPGIVKLLRVLVTFLLVSFAWIFFRANTLSDAMLAINEMFINSSALSLGDLGLDSKDWGISVLAILVLFIVEYKNSKKDVFGLLAKKNIFIRWTVLYVLIFAAIIFGAYGISFEASQFIYFQF